MAIDESQVDELFGKHTHAGRTWFDNLPEGDARDLMVLLAARAKAAGRLPNIAGTKRVLEQEFGVSVSSVTLQATLKRLMGESS